jgi:hypothetical protein
MGSVKSALPNSLKGVSRSFVKNRHILIEGVLITLRDLRRNTSAVTVGVKLNRS